MTFRTSASRARCGSTRRTSRPWSRALYALLFLGAGIFNAVTALRTPEVYVTGFAPRAFSMREFIERVVALAPNAIVLTIAVAQGVVGRGRGGASLVG